MTSRSIGTAVVTVLLLGAPVSAQQAKCLAGKTGCMAKKAAGLLKCEALAETPGKPADPNAKECVTKVRTKFDGGPKPAKGCFAKLETKVPNDCPTVDNTGAAEAAVDTCVAAIVAAIDPPPLDQTKCGAGKKKCAAKYLAALLKCRRLAQTPGKPTDPNTKGCVDKAVAKYTGGDDPTKGCFAKLQAKSPNDCQSMSDAGTVKALAENCEPALVAVVAGPPTTSTTSTTTSTTTTTTTGSTSTSTTTTPTTSTTSTTSCYMSPDYVFCEQFCNNSRNYCLSCCDDPECGSDSDGPECFLDCDIDWDFCLAEQCDAAFCPNG